MADMTTSRSLGRGLSAILGPDGVDLDETMRETLGIQLLPLNKVRPGKYQPRSYFDEDGLDSLVASVKEKGIIQPIIVRPLDNHTEGYEIVAGERRWRSAVKAELEEVPVIIREMSDQEALETAIIENVQRQDLNPLEEAEGYQRLMSDFRHTQEELGKIIGKSRSHIANTLRLLNLPIKVKEYISSGQLTAGHARTLINLDNAEEIAQKIIRQGLSVRQAEKLTQEPKEKPPKAATSNVSASSSTSIPEGDQEKLKSMMTALFGLKTDLQIKGSEGQLIIHFKTLEDLDRLLERLQNGL
ncbi:MAG: ParB/RepB/Spo0J family partition protein [Candidatus Nucleicultricaceae bacterium]